MTPVTAGALIGLAGAVAALTAVCGPWWAAWLVSRRRMRRQLAEALRDADQRHRAAASGLFAIQPEEE